MYIDGTDTFYVSDEQCARKAKFLILMSLRGEDCNVIRGIVRKVALRQMGQWMMGRIRIGRESYSLSGAYGNDGLIVDVAADAFEKGTPLPPELFEAWSHGGGWNSCGSEAPAMREWARTLPSYQRSS